MKKRWKLDRKGYTLAPFLVAAFVVAALIALFLFIVLVALNPDNKTHDQKQAHYSALSISQGISHWIIDSTAEGAPSDRREGAENLLKKAREELRVREVILQEEIFPPSMGSSVVTITYTPKFLDTKGDIVHGPNPSKGSSDLTINNQEALHSARKNNNLTEIESYTISTAATYFGNSQVVEYLITRQDGVWKEEFFGER